MRKKYLRNKRIVKRFLLFPCTIIDELRWLEIAEIEQELIRNNNYKWIWINKNWVNDTDHNK